MGGYDIRPGHVLSFLLGVPIGYYSLTHNPIALILGGLNISIFIFFVIWSFYFLKKYTNSGSLVPISRSTSSWRPTNLPSCAGS